MAKKKIQKFVFPESLLNQINEMSSCGFALFYFDEYGMPEYQIQCDSPVSAFALQNYIEHWSEAVHGLNNQTTANIILEKTFAPTPRKKKP